MRCALWGFCFPAGPSGFSWRAFLGRFRLSPPYRCALGDCSQSSAPTLLALGPFRQVRFVSAHAPTRASILTCTDVGVSPHIHQRGRPPSHSPTRAPTLVCVKVGIHPYVRQHGRPPCNAGVHPHIHQRKRPPSPSLTRASPRTRASTLQRGRPPPHAPTRATTLQCGRPSSLSPPLASTITVTNAGVHPPRWASPLTFTNAGVHIATGPSTLTLTKASVHPHIHERGPPPAQ